MAPGEKFGQFYERWLAQYNELVGKLQRELEQRRLSDKELAEEIDKVMQLYREYYRVKREAAAADVFQVLNPSWKSPLETAFMWMGGWRPSAAFRLALSVKEGKDQAEGLAGLSSISQHQLECLESEHARTKSVEDQISTQVADLQKKTADEALLDAAAAVAALSGDERDDKSVEKLRAVLDEKIRALSELVLQSDQLRVGALEIMLKILSPDQAVEYLVTAGRLHAAYTEVGRHKEAKSSGMERDLSFLF